MGIRLRVSKSCPAWSLGILITGCIAASAAGVSPPTSDAIAMADRSIASEVGVAGEVAVTGETARASGAGATNEAPGKIVQTPAVTGQKSVFVNHEIRRPVVSRVRVRALRQAAGPEERRMVAYIPLILGIGY